MFGFNKKDSTESTEEKKGFFASISKGLSKTRNQFTQGLADLFLGKKTIDEEVLEELEMRLLQADVGIKTTQYVIDELTQKMTRQEINDYEALLIQLETLLESLLLPYAQPLEITKNTGKPFMVLMVGINGAGKTTTIGKLTNYWKNQGYSILLAAGDTFRAAAVEQLQTWGERNQVSVINQGSGADSASVIFDAFQSAHAKKVDILLADTAGRLHTQGHLMKELEKVIRVVKKQDETAPHEVLLVLDASIGQNALIQAKEFHQMLGVTGLVVTKLDGTAKGGIVFAIAKELQLPIRYMGVGEKIEDLKPFDAKIFVQALLGHQAIK